MSTGCSHIKEIKDVTPSGNGCKEWLEMGDASWLNVAALGVCGRKKAPERDTETNQ